MPTALADDIDILVKAKRLIAGDYVPQDDEPYMSDAQLDYFRRLLQEWKKAILDASADTLQQLQDGPIREPDLNDRASSETDWGIDLRTRDRQRKLIAKIDSALRRIDEGEYGYCEVTGEPIGLGRLIARPSAERRFRATYNRFLPASGALLTPCLLPSLNFPRVLHALRYRECGNASWDPCRRWATATTGRSRATACSSWRNFALMGRTSNNASRSATCRPAA